MSFKRHNTTNYTVAEDTSKVLENDDCVALLIDESSHRKKGQHSAGVARQYWGTIGKVDNCQVAVYAALSAEKYYGLISLPFMKVLYTR